MVPITALGLDSAAQRQPKYNPRRGVAPIDIRNAERTELCDRRSGYPPGLILSPTLADRLLTITPTSTLPVLKRVPLVGNFGQLQSWDAHHQADRIEVGGLTLSRLHFSVTDILGAPLQLNSLPVSFSIIFEAP